MVPSADCVLRKELVRTVLACFSNSLSISNFPINGLFSLTYESSVFLFFRVWRANYNGLGCVLSFAV